MKAKLWGSLALLVVFLLSDTSFASAQEVKPAQRDMQRQIDAVLEDMDFSGIEDLRIEFLTDMPDIKTAVASLASGETFSAQSMVEYVFGAFVSALQGLGKLMLTLMLPVLLSGILTHMLACGEKNLLEFMKSACFVMILVPAVLVVVSELTHTRETITRMTGQMDQMLPLLLTLLTALGGNASSAFLHPMVVAASGSMVFLSREVILRLVMCTCAVTTVNHLSDRAHLTRMAQLLRSGVCWLLGVSFTVFLGAMSLQGVCSASIDGVTIRAAKYAVDNFVPVVGGMFSDTMDTLVGCTLIVKNSLGVTAVLALLGIVLSPLMRTLAVVFVMKLSAALLEPVADSQTVCAIEDFSRTIVLFLITMLCVSTMYFLLIVQMLLVGNLTAMLR